MEHDWTKSRQGSGTSGRGTPGRQQPGDGLAGAGGQRCTAFLGDRLIASGSIEAISRRVAAMAVDTTALRVFDDQTGRPLKFARRAAATGRPRLGVEERTATLLPRHWAWLAEQPGGASAVIRQLVERAWREDVRRNPWRHAAAALAQFLGSLQVAPASSEEVVDHVCRGLWVEAERTISTWPTDVRRYAMALMQAAEEGDGPDAGPSPDASDQKFCS